MLKLYGEAPIVETRGHPWPKSSNGRSDMYMTDPFQFSAAGYRLAGMMVENQMRVMLVFADAAFGGANPFFYPPVARRDEAEIKPTPSPHRGTPKKARVTKSRVMPQDLKRKRTRLPKPVPNKPNSEAPAHPAE